MHGAVGLELAGVTFSARPRTHVRVDARRDAGRVGAHLGGACQADPRSARAAQAPSGGPPRVPSGIDPAPSPASRALARRVAPRPRCCPAPHASGLRPTALRRARPHGRGPGRCASAARTPRARGTASRARGGRRRGARPRHPTSRRSRDRAGATSAGSTPRAAVGPAHPGPLGRHGRSRAESQAMSAASKSGRVLLVREVPHLEVDALVRRSHVGVAAVDGLGQDHRVVTSRAPGGRPLDRRLHERHVPQSVRSERRAHRPAVVLHRRVGGRPAQERRLGRCRLSRRPATRRRCDHDAISSRTRAPSRAVSERSGEKGSWKPRA